MQCSHGDMCGAAGTFLAHSPLPEPLSCPQGWLAGSLGKRCPAGDRKLSGSLRAGTPLVTGLQDANPALSEGRSGRDRPSWLRSASPLPIAHAEQGVEAPPAGLRCQILPGHHRRRTPQTAGRLQSWAGGAKRGHGVGRGQAGWWVLLSPSHVVCHPAGSGAPLERLRWITPCSATRLPPSCLARSPLPPVTKEKN